MMMSQHVRCLGALAGMAVGVSAAWAQDVTRPNDIVVGSSTNFPAGEPPAGAIDNTANTKYLNFDRTNTGFTVTPTGTGVVRSLAIVTANDAPTRDPMSFTLEGSNNGIDFSPIASGALNSPTTRFSLAQANFANSNTFTQYRVIFPTIRNAVTANSMQVGEVQLNTAGNLLTAGDGISVTYPSGGSSPVGQDVSKIVDGQLGVEFGVTGGDAGVTTVDLIPAVGASIVTSVGIFGGDSNLASLPSSVTLLGSNNGVTYTQIFTTALTQPGVTLSDQQFGFANTTSYTRYRVQFGASPSATMEVGELALYGSELGAAPNSDLCQNAQAVTAGSTSASTINATGTDMSGCGAADSKDVWFRYTATATGMVEANTCGAGTLDTVLSVYGTCGGAEIGCNDNACAGKSRVRFSAVNGTQYLIRVAGTNGTSGSFTLAVVPNPVIHSDVTVPLAYNFNGMVHANEVNDADNLTGYRSLSDRGIRLTGTPGSLDVGLEGTTGIPYSVVTADHVVDIVQLGNRNTVDAGGHAFDAVVDGDNTGVQPTWLPNVDQGGSQTTTLTALNLSMGANTKIGLIGDASNGGASFITTVEFTDNTSVQFFVDLPDWFGSQTVSPAEPGVETQTQMGLYFGAAQVDIGLADVDLNIVEVIFSTASLAAGGQGDTTGKTLRSISFSNSTNVNSGIGIYAMTVRDAVGGTPTGGVCCRGATCTTTITTSAACSSTLIGGQFAGASFVSAAASCNAGAISNTPCCYADYNKASGVSVQDIFDFLGDWFAGSTFANTGGTGTAGALSVQNIFDFLTDWFNGGCS